MNQFVKPILKKYNINSEKFSMMRIAQKIDEDGSEYFDLTQSLKAVVPVSTFINDNLLFEIKSEIKKNVLNYFINSVFNLEINDAECIFTGIKYKERYANNALGIFSSAENMENILLKGAFNFNPYNFDTHLHISAQI